MSNPDPIDRLQLFPRRIPSLDGLRALAIVNVLVGHVSLTRSFESVMNHPGLHGLRSVLNFSCNPRVGVDLFYTLSGFLITWLLLSEEGRKGGISLPMFYLRRAIRILPVYWCFLVAAELLHTFRPTVAGSPAAFLESLTFTMGWWPDDPFLLGHTWSLGVEEMFYLLWPLLLCMASGRARWGAAWCVVCAGPVIRVVLIASGQTRLYTFTPLGSADAIMWGCLLAMVLWRWPGEVRRLADWHSTAGRLLAFAVILVCNAASWNFHHPSLERMQHLLHLIMIPLQVTLHSLAAGYLIASLTLSRRGLLFRILNQRVVIGLGVLSYSLYLWQEPFLSYSPTYVPAWWQLFPQNIALAVVVAAVSYLVIERPILRLKKYLKTAPPLNQLGSTVDAGSATVKVLP